MRHTIAENINVLGKFDTGDTVTITLYKISDESVVGLDSNSCNEIGSSGVFKWNSSDITTAPTVFTEYLWVMDNSTYKQYGKIVLGGFPDQIKTETDKIQEIDNIVDRILAATEIRQCAVNDASASTTKFITNLTETDNTFWTRAAVLFTSGDNAGQIRAIKQYAGATKEVTIQTPLNTAPANGDTFIICAARKFLTPDLDKMADAVWDELKAGHIIDGSFGDILDTKISSTGGCAVVGGLQDPEIKKMFKLLETILKVVRNFNVKSLMASVAEIEESIQRKQELLKLSFQKVGAQIEKIPQPADLKEDIEVLQNALGVLIECEEFKQISQEVNNYADTKIAQIEG